MQLLAHPAHRSTRATQHNETYRYDLLRDNVAAIGSPDSVPRQEVVSLDGLCRFDRRECEDHVLLDSHLSTFTKHNRLSGNMHRTQRLLDSRPTVNVSKNNYLRTAPAVGNKKMKEDLITLRIYTLHLTRALKKKHRMVTLKSLFPEKKDYIDICFEMTGKDCIV